MWIKEKLEELKESGPTGVNFLYNQDKVYIMDNHLCAAWCWLQKVDPEKKYNFVHIDYHYDLAEDKQRIEKEIIKKNIQLHNLTFEEFLNLKFMVELANVEARLFRWDNFILAINNVYPNLFLTNTFITKQGSGHHNFVQDEIEIEHFIDEFENWLEDIEGGWIIDLDLDFFYNKNKGQFYQLYSDTTIIKVAEVLHKNIQKIDVLTIALSPECCGGWENSFKILKIFNEVMETNFHL